MPCIPSSSSTSTLTIQHRPPGSTVDDLAVCLQPACCSMIGSSNTQRSRVDENGSLLNDVAANNVLRVARMEQDAATDVSFGERVATLVSTFCGSMVFVWIHFAWFAGWIIYNTAPWFAQSPPDPFPFSFLTLVVSLEAIFLSAFILISQGREARLADRRSNLDLQLICSRNRRVPRLCISSDVYAKSLMSISMTTPISMS